MAPEGGLSSSASEPRLGSGRQATQLRSAGLTLANATTNLYDKMRSEGLFRDFAKDVRPAGVSITVPLADSAERDVQPDVYFPLPNTPAGERKYRYLSHQPGEIHVHHGLKEQKLPGEEFRYGIRGVKGESAAATLSAGHLYGLAEYKNSVAERIYESTTREPLGKPHIRGHELRMSSGGFGVPSGVPQDAKKVLFPVDVPPESEASCANYKKSHNHFQPGERHERDYTWPADLADPNFRFGKVVHTDGANVRQVLRPEIDDEGFYVKTRLVQKVCEDFRHVHHPKMGRKVHSKQGSVGHPMPYEHQYGIKSITSGCTAGSCIKGYYSLQEQLPDQDLGRCLKIGRRNVTTETRAFGVSSVRTDIPAPLPGKRSVADCVNYGDEFGCASLLVPQRFDDRGVPDSEFLLRRPREELQSLVESTKYGGGEIKFDELWDRALTLFDDGLPLVSLDALLYLHTQDIEESVRRRCSGRLAPSASAPTLPAR